MNMNTHTSTRELYRNRDNSPLDRVQIRRVAPSVFADREDDSRSKKYRFVSSDSLLDQMEEAGFFVVGAQEQRTRKPDGTPILCRVSTEEQDTSRQVSELKTLCHEKGWNVVAVVENKESGMKRSLAGLEAVKELARKGKIQKVVVSEISRIARRLSVVSKFVEEMEDLKVSIFWQNQGLETLQENGERNGVANIFLAAFAEIARNEREMTVKRIRSGLASAREKGKVLGRPKGSVQLTEDFLSKHKGIIRRVQDGLSFRDISKLEKCSFSTIKKIKAILKA